ncbi:MAG: hypothetical protein MZV70_41460 [Desulfobacterales bacterium]|nr:hypothetical protein [Desulfobacterales bacterium]
MLPSTASWAGRASSTGSPAAQPLRIRPEASPRGTFRAAARTASPKSGWAISRSWKRSMTRPRPCRRPGAACPAICAPST